MRRYDRDLYFGILNAYNAKNFSEIPEIIKKFRSGDYLPPDLKRLQQNKHLPQKDPEEEFQVVVDCLKENGKIDVVTYLENNDLMPKKSGSSFSCC